MSHVADGGGGGGVSVAGSTTSNIFLATPKRQVSALKAWEGVESMPLPLLGIASLAGSVISGLTSKSGKKTTKTLFGTGTQSRRRRRKKLTQSQIIELTQLKNLFGKTAVANILPLYLGR